MNTIKCPHCGTVFTINESEYSQLLAQVRSDAFEKEVHERLERETALLEEKAKNQLQESLYQKDKAIETLEHKLTDLENQQEIKLAQAISEKDQEITDLNFKIKQFDTEKSLLIKDNERSLSEQLAKKDIQIQEMQAQLDKWQLEQENKLQSSVSAIEKERDALQNKLQLQEKEQALSLSEVKNQYEAQLKAANEQVEFYKNFKAQQSTKAIGESLEVYAETEFNKVRQIAFPNAYFEKDNQVSSRGSKGDFIYRETDGNGIEILSIMFEMKNEADNTQKKHKNEDFFKELDKDRREKNCEYAVLVTMLEADNDYYNTGIVDVSHKYDKMYVVRPQFFIQLIGILRNAALNALQYKQELALMREQNIDITHFEEDLDVFKTAFAKNYNSASKNFQKAIDEIDKAIKRMEAVKAALTTSENQLRLANNKLEDVSVKKLTRKNPTMRAKFEELKDK
ncbi:MAG: DUF2130 domain-containing protein [Streptococcus hyointestinalis]|nr:DUF2130 domain-containing protein [Streptococcus hyointestinalis]MCI6872275.1 DUF2130 domain-containing protein [Streptococcus hyointestinalis]MDD7355607.1 DUF2130 domain-containing protein [Streptococcus hyointestinalis]MDY4553381.1 DUF2130 domain-containing protein [Streptococcus hyointestinalis]